MVTSIRATASATIACGVDEAFAHVSDVEAMDEWVDGVSNVRPVSGGGTGTDTGVGDVYEYDYAYNGRTEPVSVELTAFEPPTRIAMRSVSGPFPFASEVRLAGDDRETRLTHVVDAGADGRFTAALFALFGPLLRRLAARRLQEELADLTAMLESRDADGESGTSADSEPAVSP
jgi:hypothetical protein